MAGGGGTGVADAMARRGSFARKEASQTLLKVFKTAVEWDSWGQIEEAHKAYKDLCQRIMNIQNEANLDVRPEEVEALKDLLACFKVRILEIKNDKNHGLGLSGIQGLEAFVNTLLVATDPGPFPIDISAISKDLVSSSELSTFTDRLSRHGSFDTTSMKHTSLSRKGDILISLHTSKLGFKDVSIFADPTLTISIVDSNGVIIEQPDEIKATEISEPFHVVFNREVVFNTPMRLIENNFGFFFEFKHFKAKKKKVSTKAWCFLEQDEIQGESGKEICLEIYKKPTDFTRKTFNLLSVKPLYLHIRVDMIRV